jgi:hypothetical protein
LLKNVVHSLSKNRIKKIVLLNRLGWNELNSVLLEGFS